MKAILFLDIDGVLVPFNKLNKFVNLKELKKDFYSFDSKAVKVLKEVIEKTKCDIVISSDWKYHYSLQDIKEIFKYHGIKEPIDYTIEKDNITLQTLESDRCFEIDEWVKRNKVIKWCAVDDLDLFDLKDINFVHCNRPYSEGIKQSNIKEKLIKKLL